MTGSEALRRALPRLRAAGVEDAARDARLLLAHATGIAADRLTLHLGDTLTEADAATFDANVAARCRRQPVSQITGARLFWGRAFRVTPDVLDPRPETESLVALALLHPFRQVLDLGTGTGCILLTLLLERPGSQGVGVDLSAAALAVATENRSRLGLTERAALIEGSWFAPVTGRFDLIVANPPYIAAAELPQLAPEVRDWEPQLALSPGDDGLAAYRTLCAGAAPHLAPMGRLMVEIGPTQGQAVVALMQQASLIRVTVHPDLDGRDRVVIGHAPLDMKKATKKSLAPRRIV